ncbi:MAG: lysophospholipid acyltransferase family protein [Bdellovibrionota bacterium]
MSTDRHNSSIFSLEGLREKIINAALDQRDLDRVAQAPLKLNSAGYDPWGLEPKTATLFLATVKWLYTDYFRVQTHGIERVPAGRVMLISNHGGQFPIDGLLLGLSMILEGKPPRIVRAMVERWMPSLPFISELFGRVGQVVGDPKNCKDLLANDECIVVFPEGVRGSGKPFKKKYQLQQFGTGFVRIALETKTPIVPVAIIGHEEAYPAFGHSKWIAKLLATPYFPLTPLFPWLGPLGLVPLPTRVQIRFGEPMVFDQIDPNASDREVNKLVVQVKQSLRNEIRRGLKERGRNVFG